MTPTADKRVALEEAASLVADGSTVGIGGLSLSCSPMAFCRELVRAGTRDLELVAVVNGMATDWLIAGGCVKRLLMGLTSFEGFGLAPAFRRAAQSGSIEVEEWSEHTLICALQAAIAGVPYMPTRAGLGTDMLALHPERTWEVLDERSGQRFVACAALKPDVAIIHVHEADRLGNCRMHPKLVWFDTEVVKAATKVIVTCERIVDTDTFRAAPEATGFPSFAVDHVVEAPNGAWPTACWPEYSYDGDFYRAYQAASRDPAAYAAFLEEHIGPIPAGGGS